MAVEVAVYILCQPRRSNRLGSPRGLLGLPPGGCAPEDDWAHSKDVTVTLMGAV